MKNNKKFKEYLFKLINDCDEIQIIKDGEEIFHLDIQADNFSMDESNSFILINYTDPDGEDCYDYQSYIIDVGKVVSARILPNHYNESFALKIYLYNDVLKDELP